MKIIIPGDPEEQPRLRHFQRGGRVLCYDPKKKEKDKIKRFLHEFITQKYPTYQFPRCPKVSFCFYCSIPTTMSKKMRQYAERGLLRKRTRPDSDNYIKLYLDCLNEIFIEDDCQVSIGTVDKFYHAEPKTVIYIDECDEILNIPVGEIAHFSESCEWIREKMGSLLGYIYRPFEGISLSPSSFPPPVTISLSSVR